MCRVRRFVFSFRKSLKARAAMPNWVSCSSPDVSTFERVWRSSKAGAVILLGLSLTIVSPPFVSGQTSQQQQEQQQREEQQRQEQAREQQQREQEERDREAREEQQRQEQQRAEQQRQAEAREQQAPEQQQRDELQRVEQERQRQTPVTAAPGPTGASASANSPSPSRIPTANKVELRHQPCAKEPCVEPKPVEPDPRTKLCKGGVCPVCAPGQSPGKDNSCVPAEQTKAASEPPQANVSPHACVAGQVWNGVQCAAIGAQQCLPGQMRVGGSCQADCSMATTGAQAYIERLRMARQDKDSACLKDPQGTECRSAAATYQMRIAEYRNYLGAVSPQCTLPDPISI